MKNENTIAFSKSYQYEMKYTTHGLHGLNYFVIILFWNMIKVIVFLQTFQKNLAILVLAPWLSGYLRDSWQGHLKGAVPSYVSRETRFRNRLPMSYRKESMLFSYLPPRLPSKSDYTYKTTLMNTVSNTSIS